MSYYCSDRGYDFVRFYFSINVLFARRFAFSTNKKKFEYVNSVLLPKLLRYKSKHE